MKTSIFDLLGAGLLGALLALILLWEYLKPIIF